MKMVHIPALISLAGSLLLADAACALTAEERSYLEHASKREPLSTPPEDQILRFEKDVTGDGVPEIFYSLLSFRDGSQGYVWSVYTRSNSGSLIPMGDVTFSPKAFKPAAWEKDPSVRGFYAYGRGGAGSGSLAFYEVGVGGVTERERTKISPGGTDKETYDRIFRQVGAEGSGLQIEPVQIAVPADYDPEEQNNKQERRPRSSNQVPTPGASPKAASPGGVQDSPANTPSSISRTAITVSAVTLLIAAFAWLMLSKSRRSVPHQK